jgi:hypothetical protein
LAASFIKPGDVYNERKADGPGKEPPGSLRNTSARGISIERCFISNTGARC